MYKIQIIMQDVTRRLRCANLIRCDNVEYLTVKDVKLGRSSEMINLLIKVWLLGVFSVFNEMAVMTTETSPVKHQRDNNCIRNSLLFTMGGFIFSVVISLTIEAFRQRNIRGIKETNKQHEKLFGCINIHTRFKTVLKRLTFALLTMTLLGLAAVIALYDKQKCIDERIITNHEFTLKTESFCSEKFNLLVVKLPEKKCCKSNKSVRHSFVSDERQILQWVLLGFALPVGWLGTILFLTTDKYVVEGIGRSEEEIQCSEVEIDNSDS